MSNKKRYIVEQVSAYSYINAEKLIEEINLFAERHGLSVSDISVNVAEEPTYYDQILTSIELEAYV